jgi:hypothetical protein
MKSHRWIDERSNCWQNWDGFAMRKIAINNIDMID